MTYPETLEYLFANLPMYQRIGPAAYKKDLTNITALCAHLGNPERAFPVLHVAGTNGKGTVTHLLAAALQAAGLKVGVYSSPHFKDFRERIKINGALIPEEEVARFATDLRPFLDELQPSFFEMSTAMAFEHFRSEKVDVAVIETGLGGRLDSTNIVRPELCVITNISFDHMAMLGETLPLIAGEKAGIIKPGVPVVVGERHPETDPVFMEKAQAEGAPLLFAEDKWRADLVSAQDFEKSLYDMYYRKRTGRWVMMAPLTVELFGNYQRFNVRTAWAAAAQLMERGLFGLNDDHVREGFAQVRRLTGFRGRWEKLPGQTPAFAESAHNEAGFSMLRAQLTEIPHRNLHVVLGMVRDKDAHKALSQLPPEATYYFCRPDVPRGLEAEALAEVALELGLKGRAYPSVQDALHAASAQAEPQDLILVTGSMFVVAEVI